MYRCCDITVFCHRRNNFILEGNFLITREDIKGFLKGQKDNEKDVMLMNFVQWALANDATTDNVGKLIRDLRSYKEWIWGE
jgi:hypothetical protein